MSHFGVNFRDAGDYTVASLANTGWVAAEDLEIFTQSDWGAGANDKYIMSPLNNNATPFLTTEGSGFNQEVETFTRRGVVYFRLANDRALFMNMDGESDSVSIGIESGIDTVSPDTETFETFNFLGAAQAQGYDRTDTEDVIWTMGVSGFDFYLKYNGVEIKRFKNLAFYQPSEGKIAVKSQTAYGFRDITARFLGDADIHSDIEQKVFDLRDFGVKDIRTVGSMTASSVALTVTDNPGFEVGDTIIVEIGGEAGEGQRGTVGVGGVWPALSYADAATMNADSAQAANTICYLEDTKRVYQYASSTWTARSVASYYTSKAVPLALTAKITAINGNNFTLDTAASVATTRANVYFDNHAIVESVIGNVYPNGASTLDWLPSEAEVVIPAGQYAFSEKVDFNETNRDGWVLRGEGVGVSEVFSPLGAPSMDIKATRLTDALIKNFTLRGNARFHGFGFSKAFLDTTPQTAYPSGSAYPYGVMLDDCTDSLVRNVQVIDPWQGGVIIDSSTDCWGELIDVRMTDGLAQYIQWLLHVADSTRGGFRNCTIYSPLMTAGLETFRSTGTIFKDIRMVNCGAAVNSSGDWLFDNVQTIIAAGVNPSNGSWSTSNPIFNINTNIQPPHADLSLGGTIRNPKIFQKGVIDDDDYNGIGIVINASNTNVTVEGSYDGVETMHEDIFEAPDAAASGGTNRGSVGVVSSAPSTTVKNIRVKGTSPREASGGTGNANIHLTGSSAVVTDCIADEVVVSSGTETGTRSNATYGSGP